MATDDKEQIEDPRETPEEQEAPDPIALKLMALAADTPTEEIHKRALTRRDGSAITNADGTPKELSYITARFVMDRLDAVMGPQNWMNTYESLTSGAVRCGIGIVFDDTGHAEGRAIWKYDVGVPSSIEAEKGAHSDAFKRAGVMWGIARDLYDERDESRDVSQIVQGAVVPIAPQVPIRARAVPQQVDVDNLSAAPQAVNTGPAWVCPTHDDAREVPAGISKKSGQPYPAFLACPVAGCDQKEPFKPR